ncbi:MAG: SpoIIE family protein phosphatase, partial [Bacteroidales bacterium]|nr:SpoIIE family protein phosphatase [Bacteroidales bacterium]
MAQEFYIEVNCHQKNHHDERICGDVFLSKRIREEDRIIAVLSDGMGHGVKANVLATLTATMGIKFTEEHKDVTRTAEIIMNTLPVCSERKVSYATFTIIDIRADEEVRIIEFDNPQTIIMRGKEPFDPHWETVVLESEKNAGKEIHTCQFYPKKEDRILSFSDGITQSGLGLGKYLFGWGHDDLQEYIQKMIQDHIDISASNLAARVVNMANINDGFVLKDDSSCSVIYFRNPRKLLICTGPPFEPERDVEYAEIVRAFEGKKILCGATTCEIISRQLKREITDSFEFLDPDLPPISYMEGIDLITEGILTLGKVDEILNIYNNNYQLGKGPADQIIRIMLESDVIEFMVGTCINVAHQDPNLPVELEIRRTVVKRIVQKLEDKFLKEVKIRFI